MILVGKIIQQLVVAVLAYTAINNTLAAQAQPVLASPTHSIYQQGNTLTNSEGIYQRDAAPGSQNSIYQQGAKIPTVEGFYQKGKAKFESQQYTEAIQELSEVLRMKPDWSEVYILRGKSKIKLKAEREGLADIEQAIKIAPKDPEGYVARGEIFSEQKYRRAASSDFKYAAELYKAQGNEQKAEYYANLSSTLTAQADMIDAAARAAAQGSVQYRVVPMPSFPWRRR